MSDYVSKIVVGENEIDLTGDTAKEQHVLSGYSFHRNDGTPTSGSCTFDVDSSAVTAEKSEVLSGETFASHGKIETGTMPNRGKQTIQISNADDKIYIQNGHHDGSGYAELDATQKALIKDPSNIKSGINILGTVGTYSGEGVTAEAKEATPSFVEQTIVPTTTDYLSQVKVKPIPVTKTLNASGGYTVVVG